MSHIIATIVIASFDARVRPLLTPGLNIQEFLNELTVFFAAYPLHTFTDWVWDVRIRDINGWFIIACIILNMMGNMGVLIIEAIFAFRRACKRAYIKYITMRRLRKNKRERTFEDEEQKRIEAKIKRLFTDDKNQAT